MLQCHPHPGEFSEKSRLFHCSYFMGLQRKQGVPVSECEQFDIRSNVEEFKQQFDIRSTVEEFKHSVNMYMLWKPGMEIHVFHVKRRNIPNFVFTGGLRPARPTKVTWDSRRALELKAFGYVQPDKSVPNGADDDRKRKRMDDNVDIALRDTKSAVHCKKVCEASPTLSTLSSCSVKLDMDSSKMLESHKEQSKINVPDDLRKIENPCGNGETEVSSVWPPSKRSVDIAITDVSNSEGEKLGIEKVVSPPCASRQAFPVELDELEDDYNNYKNQVNNFVGKGQNFEMEPSLEDVSVARSVTSSGIACSIPLTNAGPEELEVIPINIFPFII